MTTAFDRSLLPPGLLAADWSALAEQFGTPLFVYDEDALVARLRAYAGAFGPDGVAYASKAFLCSSMVRLVEREGLSLDVSTGGELHIALTAGFPGERLVLHGNNKSDDELHRALEVGVGRIVIDSFSELDRLDRLIEAMDVAPPAVLVRVTPGVEAHTHEFIETGTERSKFGFSVASGAALEAACRVATDDRVRFVGLHCHIGSQVFRLDPWERALAIVMRLAAEVTAKAGVAVGEVSLGGGLGERYLADDRVPDVTAYARALHAAADREAAAAGLSSVPSVVVEPGRSIAARAGVTLYRVGTVKVVPGFGTYVAIDGGMSDNPRPVLYGAGYEAFLPRAIDAERPLEGAVVGKHCEQGDVIVADARFPSDVAVGDLLVTPVTGAYGHSMASNYNAVPRPAVVFVAGGISTVVVARESLDDLVRRDMP